jgi:hypothetical protein
MRQAVTETEVHPFSSIYNTPNFTTGHFNSIEDSTQRHLNPIPSCHEIPPATLSRANSPSFSDLQAIPFDLSSYLEDILDGDSKNTNMFNSSSYSAMIFEQQPDFGAFPFGNG